MDINKIIDVPDCEPYPSAKEAAQYAGECKAKQDMDWAECTLDWQVFDEWMEATYRNSCNSTSVFMVGYHSVMQKEMEEYGFWDLEDEYV